jgi:hypothetical protein
MSDQNTERATEPASADRAAEVAATERRGDDRNQALDESPTPDPEAKDTTASDDPQAD